MRSFAGEWAARHRVRPLLDPAASSPSPRTSPWVGGPGGARIRRVGGEGRRSKTMASMEEAVVGRLKAAKRASGKSYSEIAAEVGLTNVYVAQLLRRQAQLKPGAAAPLRAAVPGLTDDLLSEMMAPPFRSFRPDLVRDPAIYRLNEAIMHFGESIKEIINEDFGDGIINEDFGDAIMNL